MAKTPGVPHAFGCFFIVFYLLQSNLWCLTGANMTGKSTLLKTIGSCVYLAHLGSPVPADAMKTVHFDGIMVTINLGDNLSTGASHLFNEV